MKQGIIENSRYKTICDNSQGTVKHDHKTKSFLKPGTELSRKKTEQNP